MGRSSLLRSLLRFDRSNWRAYTATRCTVGVALPILLSAALGHPAWGVLASLGALYAGMASFNGVYLARLRLMLGTTAMMSLVTLLGSAVSAHAWLTICTVVGVAFVLALFAAKSTAANTIAIQGTGVLVVLSGIPQSAANPLGNALVVLAGGLGQTLLLTLVWPVNPHYPERRVVSAVFASLARFVGALEEGSDQNIPEAQPFIDARALMDQSRHSRQHREHVALQHALRSAEAIRAGLVGFSRADAELRQGTAEDVRRADATAAAIERELLKIGDQLRKGVELGAPPTPAALGLGEDRSGDYDRWVDILLHILVELRQPPTEVDEVEEEVSKPSLFSFIRMPDSGALRSLAFQHALRYAITLGFAIWLSRAWGVSHGYWLPLTVALLLRPDYATTLTRGIGRLAGTLVGVMFASLVVHFAHPSPSFFPVWILIATWFACALYLANYMAYSVAITLYVVFSVSATGLPEGAAGVERLEATLAGVVLAVAGNLLWPIWESRKVRDVLRDAIRAQKVYAEAVRDLVSRPGSVIAEETRHCARTLRIEAERIVESAKLEPMRGRRHLPVSASEIVMALDENAAVLLTLHAEALQRNAGRLPDDPESLTRVLKALNRDNELEALLSGGDSETLIGKERPVGLTR